MTREKEDFVNCLNDLEKYVAMPIKPGTSIRRGKGLVYSPKVLLQYTTFFNDTCTKFYNNKCFLHLCISAVLFHFSHIAIL